MKRTNDDIEGPVRKSPWLLAGGIVVLAGLTYLGVFLLLEALRTPEGPQDMLDMKRMAASGIGVILFSIAVGFFLFRLYKPGGKQKSKRKPTKRKTVARKKPVKR